MLKISIISVFLLILLELNAFQHSACLTKINNNDDMDDDEQDSLNQWTIAMEMFLKINETNQQSNVSYVSSKYCMQMQCNILCFNGDQKDLENDIQEVLVNDEHSRDCDHFNEIRLYNYDFFNGTLPVRFLGQYSNKVEAIYIVNSNVIQIQAGAFGDGIFRKIHLEDLKIDELHKSFFENITSNFESLSIVQREKELAYVSPEFLYHVRYQIKSLTLNAGIDCVRNVTASENLLNNLEYVDFKYNNFSDQLQQDTFSQLSVVDHLDLSHSEIEFLPDYIFKKMEWLVYLNISHNKILTISKLVFTSSWMPRNLYVYANDNPWVCDCHLQNEMVNIFIYHVTSEVYCEAPAEYKDWSVFDRRLCHWGETSVGWKPETTGGIEIETLFTSTTSRPITKTTNTEGTYTVTTTRASQVATTTTEFETTSTSALIPMTSTTPSAPSTTLTSLASPTTPITPPDGSNGSMSSFECIARNFSTNEQFSTSFNGNFAVKITFSNKENFAPSKRVLWFCKKAKEKQLLLENKNNVGCYNPVSNNTIVPDLLPDMSYTFCLIDQDQVEISPFACKSEHVRGNILVVHHVWSNRKVRATRISLLVFGIVLSLFGGILAVFLLLKHKPMLLKGNKRIMTPKSSTGEIIVLPKHKTVEQMNHKEAMLAKSHDNRFLPCINRRDSIVSIASTVSYMNTNLYEYIPTYLQLEDVRNTQSGDYFEIQTASPLSTTPPLPPSSGNCYAKIPQHRKRTSSDPLPELPGSTLTTFLIPTLPRVSDASAIYAVLDNQI